MCGGWLLELGYCQRRYPGYNAGAVALLYGRQPLYN